MGALRPILAAVACAAAVLACGERDARAPGPAAATGPAVRSAVCPSLLVSRPSGRESLVFVLSDTLRRDRLSIYGGAARTPAFDAFAAENILFLAASSQAPWTKPSIASLFTGLLPSQHGVVSHPRLRHERAGRLESDVLAGTHVTLAEALSAAGYETAAFVSNPWLQRALGFAQGFDVYDDSFAANATRGTVVTRAGLDWLASRDDPERPFFLYLHYMDAHAPYPRVSPEALAARREEIASDHRPVTPRARGAIAGLARNRQGAPLARDGVEPNLALMELVYDQGVERFDASLGDLLEGLDDDPAARAAAVVVTADHGEALFERGWRGHGFGLFENEVGVPLAMSLPGVSADGPVSCPVGLVDLRASLCDYLGVDCPGAGPGRSIFSTGAQEGPRTILSEAVVGRPRHRSVRDERYKLIYEPGGRPAPGALPARREYSLFDLRSDPGETRNLLAFALSPEQESALERLKERLHAAIPSSEAGEGESVPLDSATRERLEALGYLDGGERGSDPLEDE